MHPNFEGPIWCLFGVTINIINKKRSKYSGNILLISPQYSRSSYCKGRETKGVRHHQTDREASPIINLNLKGKFQSANDRT